MSVYMYIQKGEYMKTNKSRFIVILLMLSMVAVACGGDTAEDVAETPEVTEAPQETLAAPATVTFKMKPECHPV